MYIRLYTVNIHHCGDEHSNFCINSACGGRGFKLSLLAFSEVFRTVVLKQTDPGLVTQTTGDIIAFYNAVRTYIHCQGFENWGRGCVIGIRYKLCLWWSQDLNQALLVFSEMFWSVVLKQTDPGLVAQTLGDIIAFYKATCTYILSRDE